MSKKNKQKTSYDWWYGDDPATQHDGDLFDDYDDPYYSTGSRYGNTSKGYAIPKCYESHPPLKIGDYLIYGGSCSTPVEKDADIYIGFDYSMRFTPASYPWNGGTQEVLFRIHDMQAPDDPKEFRKLVEWTAEQLKAGKKIHAGCIGGHGRTGTFLAALVKHMTGNKDAIKYVRDNYCHKAVETETQIGFLEEEWGIKYQEPTKSFGARALYGSKTLNGKTGKTYGRTSSTSRTTPAPNASGKSFLGKNYGGAYEDASVRAAKYKNKTKDKPPTIKARVPKFATEGNQKSLTGKKRILKSGKFAPFGCEQLPLRNRIHPLKGATNIWQRSKKS